MDIRNGGSEILATRNMKNTMTWTFFSRYLFARIKGRMSSMAAPVVPIQLAKIVPMKITPVLTMGFPTKDPVSCTPPEMVNKDRSRMMNGTYSKSPT